MKVAIFGSLLLSILHSILFWGHKAGISVILFALPAVLFLLYLLEKQGKIKSKKASLLTIPIFLLSSTYFIFDNKILSIVNFFVILALLASMIIWTICDKFQIGLFLSKVFNIILGPIEFFGDVLKQIKEAFSFSKKDEKNTKSAVVKKVIKAILISIPIVLVVLFLLVSADDTFARLFNGITKYVYRWLNEVEIFSLVFRIIVIVALFVYFVSFIYNLIHSDSSFNQMEEIKRKREVRIDPFNINTVLTLLNVIYLIFSGVQIWLLCTNVYTNITQYSKNARQGFFQLVIVSLINLVLIILATANKKEEGKISIKYRKIMNALMICFNIVLLVVAFARMNLYESNYGYTILRLLVYWGIITEGLLLVPTAIYALKGKTDLFKSYFFIVTVMYVVLNFMNMDYIIAKQNVDRYMETGKIDISYIKYEVGSASIPQIKRVLETDESMQQKDEDWEKLMKDINSYLYSYKQNNKKDERGWQSFNLSRNKANKTLENMVINYYYSKSYYNL